MSTATNDSVRTIGGRRIERTLERDGATGQRYWWYRSVTKHDPIERLLYDEASGHTMRSIENVPPTVHWDSEKVGPGERFQQAMALYPAGRPDQPVFAPFDPREPSRLHDQLEQADAAGFQELADAFRISAKVKDRGTIKGRFALGAVLARRGMPTDETTIRRFLHQHSNMSAIELTDEQRWCPALFWPFAY
jgi:hypothetical protein